MKYSAVLFDLDGTVLDTSEGIAISVRDTIEHFDLKKYEYADLLKFIGPPIEWSFESKCGVTGDKLKEVSAYFRDRYANHNLLLAKPYEGIYELMAFLKEQGIPMGIATYKRQTYATTLLNHYKFNEYMDVMIGSDPEGTLSKADIINICIDKIGGGDPSKVLMVGDSKHDANGAKIVGAPFAGVSYGFGFGQFGGENIEEFDHVIYADKPLDLKALF